MSEAIYLNLREFLDKLPGSFPATKSGVEIKILKKLFTPEQAHIALKMGRIPESVLVIASRLGMEEAQASEKLEAMAKEGLIYRVRLGDKAFYMALQFVIGIYEFHLNTLDRELSEMMEEYFPYIGEIWQSTKTKQLRVVPIGSSVDTTHAVSTYNHIRELVKNKKMIAVAPCICQKEHLLMGNTCSRPAERCILFDNAAQYYIENRMGRQVTMEELMTILKMGEEKALVLSPTNAKNIVNICMCCGCCCGVLRILKNFPRPADQVQSPFQANIDPELCTLCGTCQERCQMDAINENGEAFEIDLARCIGCGLCIPTCPSAAISLLENPEVAPVPNSFMEMLMTIAKERGVR